MQTTAFTALRAVHLPSASRLLASSCCPDKDLVVLLSRLGGIDRISLWNSGSCTKVWEVDIGDENNSAQVIALAWSPDGQSIAVAHDPPSITLHSIQDGVKHLTLPINTSPGPMKRTCRLTGLWWFREEKLKSTTSTPDIFQRGDVITGTAQSILNTLPLLDSLAEESIDLTATDIFAFQGSHVHSTSKPLFPDVIAQWPTLSPDPEMASIRSSSHISPETGEGIATEADDSNLNSILLAADTTGRIYYFLDGHYPLGDVLVGSQSHLISMFNHLRQPSFFGHKQTAFQDSSVTSLRPTVIDIPLLSQRNSRDLAKLSSISRELVFYGMRVIKDMRNIWFGSESTSGARELGPKWVRALETKQKDQYGQEEPNPILDLTCLLVTGRASDSLLDFLGSGEQMSERGIQKWETTLSDALVKLRDYSEKRVAPACQRLHLVLEEILGWAMLPQYHHLQLSADDLHQCLALVNRAIIISSWLAAVARRELSRFREFISWLRFEASAANPANDNSVTPRHDILEVNNYFMSGLVVSSIDKWFLGPVPHFHPLDLGIPGENEVCIPTVVERGLGAANDPTQMAWQANIAHKDLSHLDRNLDALIQELALRCQRVFSRAAGAACRSAIISSKDTSILQEPATRHIPQQEHTSSIRERTTMNESRQLFQQSLAVCMLSEGKGNLIGLARLSFNATTSELPCEVGVALLECYLPEEHEQGLLDLDLLEAEFLDDECVVIVYRPRSDTPTTYIATIGYHNVGYQTLPVQGSGHENLVAREDLMHHILEEWKEGHLASERVPIERRRALVSCRIGGVHLAVNGKAGRRLACVLDSTGTTLESFDLEEDAGSDDPTSRMSDVALRKKKNADAQAAFRARRANYIATLEETVTSLESVVLQLQESCREARNDAQSSRQEISRLRHEFREREKFWRGLWQARKTGQAVDSDDIPLPPSFSSAHPQTSSISSHIGSSLIPQYASDTLGYRAVDDSPICQSSPYSSAGPAHAYQNHSPPLPYSVGESIADNGSTHVSNSRNAKYSPYPYPPQPANRDNRWPPQAMAQTTPSTTDSSTTSNNPTPQPSGYLDPSTTISSSDMPYPSRFLGDEQKLAVNALDNAPYVFPSSLPHSRSMSPTNSTPGSSSTSLTSFQFTFPDNSLAQERPEFDYRRHSIPHAAEMTLHGGTADISLAGSVNDAVRYRLGTRRVDASLDTTQASTVGHLSGSDNGSQHDRGSSDGDATIDSHSRSQARQSTVPSQSSRSPSPSNASVSCTVAVIKAHAFGALRRTRTRAKKSSDGPARVAMDVLEARGLGLGVPTGSKRPRLHDDDFDDDEV
ncbi:anaphase-promoting complex, cyclosome, subunit 4-domain-containing protein [Crucibulum laeve]|uniref:Anaphase-promoting complex subunit 4 n=1 Tax=Crucibulum laeve TaxID=68775 RepID=A0A5C3MBF2_9AGAR|nr:anaphase-promoting complex, cyclosome, subunit 4-domain-containing protein [Crucibulum laeve]